MPFFEEDKFYGPLAIPDGMNLLPETRDVEGGLLGAAFRMENPILSAFSDFDYDTTKPFDPDYRPWDHIQGTQYEPYATRFSGARDAEDVQAMKMQIDRELEDRATIDAAGWQGWVASMAASLLSPTSLLPGGAIVRGAKGGVLIVRTALSVGVSASTAAAIDEAFLHSSQQTRTVGESAVAIGGSFILGGMLGSAAGSMSAKAFKAASRDAEESLRITAEFDDALRSIGAAENRQDFEIRREKVFQTINAIPVLRGIVRSDPILRGQLSPLDASRQATAQLAETPLQYRVNEEGRSVLGGEVSVETRIKDRERNELAKALGGLQKAYGDYWNDGSVGTVGTLTAPVTARFSRLLNRTEKLNSQQFMEEVGKAMRSGDKHPIPQVQAAADALRRDIFDSIKDEAIQLGIFDPDLKVTNADSYFTRVYNMERIRQHFGDGTADDIAVVLRDEFKKRRAEAQERLAFDRTVDELETAKFRAQETARTSQQALDTAFRKARAKRDRAQGAVSRDGAVGRATGALRKVLQARSDDLASKVLQGDELDALKEAVRDARSVDRLEPRDIFKEVRSLGGIREDGSGELQASLDTFALSLKRNDGMHPDDMRGALEELGYLPPGSTEADFWDAMRANATGEKVYSAFDAEDIARYEAAREFRDSLTEIGVDVSEDLDTIIKGLPGKARNQKVTKAKSDEAGRSAGKAGEKEVGAEARVMKALGRLDEAQARLKQLKDEVSPKVREEITAARAELRKIIPELRKAKKAQEAEEFYAGADDLQIEDAVNETIQSLLGMKSGQHAYQVSFATPTRARVLDIADEKLEPWLESNAEMVLAQYFRSMVPDLEMTRTFGRDFVTNFSGSETFKKINDEAVEKMANAKTLRERKRIDAARKENIRDIEAMRDRLRHTYGTPKDPSSIWVQAGRGARSFSYMGYLGGMMLSAIPDVASVVGRVGIEGAFGTGATALTKPGRLFRSSKDMAEIGAAAEWYLNTRAQSLGEMFDPYGRGTRLERVMGQGARHFSIATGMIHWNMGWKSVGMAAVGSRMAKAIDASRAGKITKKDRIKLAENGIEPWMADRIAVQLDRHADKDGTMWLPQGRLWDDKEAFDAFRYAMNRESDLMVITPGLDTPNAFSTELGKFALQFKSFAFSAHHRILLSGIQRADADVVAQVTTAIILGGLVSNIKARMGGYEEKEGAAFWEDAIDRSGLAGWLMEPYNIASGVTGGATSVSGESVSRYQSRSMFQGLAGPSFDMGTNLFEAANAFATGNHSYRDVRKAMRPIPGNNLWWFLPITRQIEDAVVEATGARPQE